MVNGTGRVLQTKFPYDCFGEPQIEFIGIVKMSELFAEVKERRTPGHGRRSVLTALGIIIGIGAVMLAFAIITILQVRNQLKTAALQS